LTHTNLSQANLNCADLSEADLRQATLDDAFLMNAKLKDAKLGIDRLSKVVTLFGATLDPQVEQELKTAKPELFRRPTSATVDELKSHKIKITNEDLNAFSDLRTEKAGVQTEVEIIPASQEKPSSRADHNKYTGLT